MHARLAALAHLASLAHPVARQDGASRGGLDGPAQEPSYALREVLDGRSPVDAARQGALRAGDRAPPRRKRGVDGKLH